MNHKQMTAHIRNRIKAAGIKAKCKMQDYCGNQIISVDIPAYGIELSAEEQRIIRLIAITNKNWKLMKTNAPQLRNLMATHKLTCRQVGEILHRHPATVRNWRMLESGNDIPDGQLRLLQFELFQKLIEELL